MDRIAVTDAQVIDMLKAVVAERPDYVYVAPEHQRTDDEGDQCFYVHTDEDGSNPRPGCVVGEVFHRLGAPLGAFKTWEGSGAFSIAGVIFDGLTLEAREILGITQMWQDRKHPWSVALENGLSLTPVPAEAF